MQLIIGHQFCSVSLQNLYIWLLRNYVRVSQYLFIHDGWLYISIYIGILLLQVMADVFRWKIDDLSVSTMLGSIMLKIMLFCYVCRYSMFTSVFVKIWNIFPVYTAFCHVLVKVKANCEQSYSFEWFSWQFLGEFLCQYYPMCAVLLLCLYVNC